MTYEITHNKPEATFETISVGTIFYSIKGEECKWWIKSEDGAAVSIGGPAYSYTAGDNVYPLGIGESITLTGRD